MAETYKKTKADIFKIDPRNIVVVEGFNSRSNFGDLDELARQIKEQGVLNPISVQVFTDEDGTEKYNLVDGERRYRAVMKLIEAGEDIARIPAIFIPKNLTQEELLIQQALRNEGKNFNEFEWGVLCQKLMQTSGKNKVEIAQKLGKNPGMITYYLNILNMRPEIQELVKSGSMTGVDVRKILQAHEYNEAEAWKEIQKLMKIAEKKGKKKIELRDLDINSKTILHKDSKFIEKGLKVLFDYVKRYSTGDGSFEAEIDLADILKQLKAGKNIAEIFDGYKANIKTQTQVG